VEEIWRPDRASLDAEHCYKCDAETGRAGRHDDSLYADNGAGPFCESCYEDYVTRPPAGGDEG